MSDKSDGGTASGVWVPSSPSSDSSDSSDSEPYTKRPESGREGKRKRAPHKTRSPRGGRRAHAKQPKHRSRGRSSHSSAHSNGSPSAASELPESGTEAPESGSTSSMGVSVADAGNDGCGVVALDELVYVPELDRKVFESWDVLEAYLRTYSRRTFQTYSKCSSITRPTFALITGTHGRIKDKGGVHIKTQERSAVKHRSMLVLKKPPTGKSVKRSRQLATTTLSAAKPIRRWMCLVTTTGRQPYAEGLRLKDPASILLCKRLSNDGNTKLLFSRSHQMSYDSLFASEWIKANSVWEQLKTAASSMDLETEKLFFFGVINYDLNHWFDVSANLSNGVQPSADWR
ncbi:hypothetical protein PI126_g3155 [Phytophthora idaei]|nr:hypothetical protein PI126_g3155 [Phytophthora idaei]